MGNCGVWFSSLFALKGADGILALIIHKNCEPTYVLIMDFESNVESGAKPDLTSHLVVKSCVIRTNCYQMRDSGSTLTKRCKYFIVTSHWMD